MSTLEDDLLFQVRAVGLPEPVREYRAIEGRRFRWDFAYIEQRLLIEVSGGVYVPNTAHTSGKGISRDCEKANLATLQGYRQLTFTAAMIKDGTAIQMIQEALG